MNIKDSSSLVVSPDTGTFKYKSFHRRLLLSPGKKRPGGRIKEIKLYTVKGTLCLSTVSDDARKYKKPRQQQQPAREREKKKIKDLPELVEIITCRCETIDTPHFFGHVFFWVGCCLLYIYIFLSLPYYHFQRGKNRKDNRGRQEREICKKNICLVSFVPFLWGWRKTNWSRLHTHV